jgi:hypothetical protein
MRRLVAAAALTGFLLGCGVYGPPARPGTGGESQEQAHVHDERCGHERETP